MNANFSTLPKNVIHNLCSYLDIKSIRALGEVDKKTNKLIFSHLQSWLVWRKFYPELELLGETEKKDLNNLIKKLKTRSRKTHLLEIAKKYEQVEKKQTDYERLDSLGKMLFDVSCLFEKGLKFFKGGSNLDKQVPLHEKYFNREELEDMHKIGNFFSKELRNQPFGSIVPWQNSELLKIYKKHPAFLQIPVYGYDLTPLALLCKSAAWFYDFHKELSEKFVQMMQEFVDLGATFDADTFSNFKFDKLSIEFVKVLFEKFSDHIKDDWRELVKNQFPDIDNN